jgi:apolipoprotein D and lipocalin family protein
MMADVFNKILSPQGNYWVLDTDYQQYALVYSCQKVFSIKIQQAWYLSRTPTLNQTIQNNLANQLSQFDPVLVSQLEFTDQVNCPW